MISGKWFKHLGGSKFILSETTTLKNNLVNNVYDEKQAMKNTFKIIIILENICEKIHICLQLIILIKFALEISKTFAKLATFKAT